MQCYDIIIILYYYSGTGCRLKTAYYATRWPFLSLPFLSFLSSFSPSRPFIPPLQCPLFFLFPILPLFPSPSLSLPLNHPSWSQKIYPFATLLSASLWPPYVIGGPLYFYSVVSIFLFFLAKSQRPQIGCLPYFSTHGVALMRIYNAGLKHAALGWLEIQDAKKSPKIAISAPSHKFVGPYLRN